MLCMRSFRCGSGGVLREGAGGLGGLRRESGREELGMGVAVDLVL